jgi:hypothetical protein
VELVLYVSDSAQSRRALRAMQRALDGMSLSRVKVIIRNIEREPLESTDDAIAVTPVLIKNHPGEQERFVRNLDSAHSLAALIHDLESCSPPSSRQA